MPWLASLRGMSSPTLRLHNEIVSLCSYLASTQEEEIARRNAISRVEDVVRSIWPDARLEVFGSFATGLYLPTSDVDAVILDSGCTDIPQGLKALATSMARRNIACNMQVISKARVPIVKFEESESGYNFDISFDVANGPEAAANVRGIMDRLPPMRPLVMVLKVFLHQRQLNEVYSGGVGSYALLVMVACFLQTHPSRRQARPGTDGLDTNLGCLLIDFFRFYGRALQQQSVGVSCRRGGFFFSKRSKGFFTEERPYLLSVEDPNDATNDLGKNSYNISRARMAFDYAYCRLTAPAASGESMLARIIRLDPALFCRQPVPLGAENSGPARDREHRNGNVERADRVNRRDGDGTAVLEVDGEAVDGSSAAAGDHAAKKKKKRRDRKRKQLERDGKPVDSAEERTEGDGKGEEEIEGGQAQRKRRRWGRGGAQRRKGGAPGPQQLPQRQEDPREKGRNEREGKRRRR